MLGLSFEADLISRYSGRVPTVTRRRANKQALEPKTPDASKSSLEGCKRAPWSKV